MAPSERDLQLVLSIRTHRRVRGAECKRRRVGIAFGFPTERFFPIKQSLVQSITLTGRTRFETSFAREIECRPNALNGLQGGRVRFTALYRKMVAPNDVDGGVNKGIKCQYCVNWQTILNAPGETLYNGVNH
jgi:hypothetical protein